MIHTNPAGEKLKSEQERSATCPEKRAKKYILGLTAPGVPYSIA